MNRPKLKPCPFCGGEAELMINELSYGDNSGVVMCMSCFACGPEKEHWANAELSWNDRPKVSDPADKGV